jgi:hypothetical protein
MGFGEVLGAEEHVATLVSSPLLMGSAVPRYSSLVGEEEPEGGSRRCETDGTLHYFTIQGRSGCP